MYAIENGAKLIWDTHDDNNLESDTNFEKFVELTEKTM